jgi:hypothetical protein
MEEKEEQVIRPMLVKKKKWVEEKMSVPWRNS